VRVCALEPCYSQCCLGKNERETEKRAVHLSPKRSGHVSTLRGSGRKVPRRMDAQAYGCCVSALTRFTRRPSHGVQPSTPGGGEHNACRRPSERNSALLKRMAGDRAPLTPHVARPFSSRFPSFPCAKINREWFPLDSKQCTIEPEKIEQKPATNPSRGVHVTFVVRGSHFGATSWPEHSRGPQAAPKCAPQEAASACTPSHSAHVGPDFVRPPKMAPPVSAVREPAYPSVDGPGP